MDTRAMNNRRACSGNGSSSRCNLPGDHDSSAGTAKLGQIAGGGHADLQPWAFPANDRTIVVRRQQRALQASTSGTSAVARLAELAGLARVGKRAGWLEGRGV